MKIRELLIKIQNSDEKTKNRWLIGASAVSIIIIIIFWLIYLKFSINPVVQNIETEDTVGFWQIFKNGLKILSQFIKDFITGLFSKFTGGKTIIIE